MRRCRRGRKADSRAKGEGRRRGRRTTSPGQGKGPQRWEGALKWLQQSPPRPVRCRGPDYTKQGGGGPAGAALFSPVWGGWGIPIRAGRGKRTVPLRQGGGYGSALHHFPHPREQTVCPDPGAILGATITTTPQNPSWGLSETLSQTASPGRSIVLPEGVR